MTTRFGTYIDDLGANVYIYAHIHDDTAMKSEITKTYIYDIFLQQLYKMYSICEEGSRIPQGSPLWPSLPTSSHYCCHKPRRDAFGQPARTAFNTSGMAKADALYMK